MTGGGPSSKSGTALVWVLLLAAILALLSAAVLQAQVQFHGQNRELAEDLQERFDALCAERL